MSITNFTISLRCFGCVGMAGFVRVGGGARLPTHILQFPNRLMLVSRETKGPNDRMGFGMPDALMMMTRRIKHMNVSHQITRIDDSTTQNVT